MLAIIDYKMGNIYSIQSALSYLGVDSILTDSEDDILNADFIVLPGVGSFKKAMNYLNTSGLTNVLKIAALEKKIPFLGICLGMQLLGKSSPEDGLSTGLGLVDGVVERFIYSDNNIKIPHVGFATVDLDTESNLFKGLGKSSDFYFTHSYRMQSENAGQIIGECEHGEKFVAAIHKENIYGTQFHPEKSQSNGLIVLKNFLEVR